MNQIDLRGRYAVVTGGASGLGYAVARRLIASGAKVAIWDSDARRISDAKATLSGAGPWITADVCDPVSLHAALKVTGDEFSAVDILVNNAGITGPNATTWDSSLEDWEKVLRVNLTGTFICSKLIVPRMREQNYGRIVNIASVAGKEGNPNACAYSASKAAVIALTKSLAKELASTGVRVNCVTPAAVVTPLFEQMTKAHIDFMLSKIPLGRFGEAAEVASLVAWLCSEECSFSTGAAFDLSGGRSTY
jgi:2-dehydro-3-deoxy-L-rhamnonate dehydrogenase (NAD+)